MVQIELQALLTSMHRYAKENYVPIILDETKEVLENILNSHSFSHILEVGTAIGYSGIVMLENSIAHLTTLEKDETRHNLATQNFLAANLSHRVSQVLGDAFEFIKTNTQTYDFIFLDGPKGQYMNYLPYLIKSLKPNGILFADNVFFKGMVESGEKVDHKVRTIVTTLRSFLAFFKDNPQFKTTLLHQGDGILIAQKL